MTILTQEQLLLNAQVQFDALKEQILADSQGQIRIDQAERNVFDELLGLGLTLLQAESKLAPEIVSFRPEEIVCHERLHP